MNNASYYLKEKYTLIFTESTAVMYDQFVTHVQQKAIALQ
jgi:hypothetical protein